MREVDGLIIFDKADIEAEAHEAFRLLSKVSLGDVRLPHGFKIVELENEKFVVVPLSEENWLSYMKRVNPNFEYVSNLRPGCYQISERRCSTWYCGDGYRCSRAYDPINKVYWCGCM